ncbi:hypothetical protein JL456_23925 [Vibrio neptunius]|uniref:Integral membrane protein n=1 Tax=Vibrio neptunius TaxID=170651 RepID=A0ABS3AA04_9VIBR|nr:hypothetical protein [Vibrio neptunius]MBN3495850.1 hypothetical protein [Vibrio neptunius]MBN3518264.1 hypothetical protein [Vibrio neptunius]MBN3552599.1 hypothetical protein [Vibrio neptunius]MBN3580662.1 hypothetical protein [Vibrio neptunius]MCH9874328.1 hypothetical protein [Vibrio neptunius]
MLLTFNVLCLLAAPLLVAFVVFNIGLRLLGEAVARHSIARRTYAVFGLVGTPIHELSHLLVALIFGHKITGLKLFSWRTSGYVSHSYNAHSTFQVAGNFFIAMAPFMACMALAYYWGFRDMNLSVDLTLDPINTMTRVLEMGPELFYSFVSTNPWWKTMLLIMISFYCVPSNTDFANALRSLFLSVPIFFVLVFAGVMFFPGLSQLVGAVLFMGILSTMTAIIWWVVLYLITFLPGNIGRI